MLRFAKMLMITAALILASSVDSASAQPLPCNTKYEGPPGGAWQNSAYWDVRVPLPTDVACIPDNREVAVWMTTCDGGTNDQQGCGVGAPCPGGICVTADPAEAAAIRVETDGIITVLGPGKLILHGHATEDSRLDGLMNLTTRDGNLLIADEVTIVSKGGLIQGRCMEIHRSHIEAAPGSSGAKLILEGGHTCSADPPPNACSQDSDCTSGTCTASGTPNARADSLVIRGQIDLVVELVNNAYVVAQAECPMLVRGDAKSGNGWWIGEAIDPATFCYQQYPGGLDIQTSISGSANWLVSDDFMPSFININEPCTSLTGDTFIGGGTFDVNENFISTGNFMMNRGRMEIAPGKKAQFN